MSFGLSSGCDVTLARNLREVDADRIATELNQHGIAATKLHDGPSDSGYRLEISANSVEGAWHAVAPWSRPNSAAHDTAADDPPLLPTRSDQQLRLNRDLAHELARSIELMPGVVRARVHLTLPAPSSSLADLLAPPVAAASAAVLLVRRHGAAKLAEPVQSLIAGAVAGLARESIRIVETVAPEPEPRCAALVRIGPLSVSEATSPTLKLWLGLALALQMLLAGALLFVLGRKR